MTDAPATNELLGHFPLQYSDGPDYCTVKDAPGADFALTVQPDLMRLMEDALRAAATPSAEVSVEELAAIIEREIVAIIHIGDENAEIDGKAAAAALLGKYRMEKR